MTWTSGEIITATRLEDKNDRNKASGYLGLDGQKLVTGSCISDFNLLKIAASSNIFETVQLRSGTVAFSNINGTVNLTTNAYYDGGASEGGILEWDKYSLSSRPHKITFKIESILISATTFVAIIGLSQGYGIGVPQAVIETVNGGTNWIFRTYNAGYAVSSNIAAPAPGDIFTIYATPIRASLIKNSSWIVTHTSGIPTVGIGRYADMQHTSGQYSSYLNLSFMS